MDVMWTSKMLMHAFLNFVLQISVDLAEIAFCKIFKVTIYTIGLSDFSLQ